MEKHEEQASGVFNNFELKRRFCDFRRRRLLKKLENDLRELGLSRWATRRGLMQLIIKPYVILRRVPDSYREKIFQYSNQNLLSNHKEILQSKQNDMEKKQQTDSSQDIHHKEKRQIPSNITISSNSIMDGNKICQNKIHESSSSKKMLSSGTIQNSVQEVAKKNFHIDNNVTRNHKDISAEKLNINATSSASLSKNELLSKHAQHFIHKSINKSSCSENKIFLKDKSTSISTKSTNISVSQKYVLSEDKSSEREDKSSTEPIQLKKHCLDSKNSIDFSKDNAVFAGKNKEKQKSETESVKEFSSEKIKLVDTFVQENFDKSRNDNSFPKSSSNTIISELKSCSKKKVNDSRNKNQNAISEKYMQASQGNLELLAEEIGMPLNYTFERKNMNQIQINLKSKNLQRNNLFIDMSSKIKKRTNYENLDENTSLTKIRKRKKTDASPDKKMIDNNAKISNYEILSDNECDHGKQRNWENVTKCMVKERKHKLLKRKSELCRKERNKIKKIQDKFHDYFRDTFDPDTSENEEEYEILLNCFERKKQYFDNLLYDTATTDYEAEDISKMNKYSIHKSTNNSQNDIESAASVKIKFSNICDSTTCTEKYDVIYDAVTDEETEDKISAYKRSISATTSQENVESTILTRIKSEDSLYNSITSTENYATLVAATDEKIKDRASIHDTLINNSQKDTESAISIEVKSDDNNSCDSNASIEKCYAMHDNATDEKDKISIYESGMSINNFQENIENEIPIEINSDDSSCASTISTEKYYAIYDIIANEKVKDEPLICESDMSVDNSQENMENMTQTKVKSDDSSCNSAASTEKCYTIHDIKDEPLIYGSDIYGSINNSQENFVNAILTKIKSINKSCDFIASTETCYARQYVSRDATTEKKIKYKTPMCKSSTSINNSINNSQKNIVDAILIKIKSVNKSCDFIASTETCYAVCHYAVPHYAPRYISPYITVNEKRKDEILTCESSTSTNSQENIKNAIPTEAKSNDGSFDSTASTGNYCATHISTTDERIKDKVSTCKPDTSFNNLQENIRNVIQTKISHDRSCDSTASTKYYDRHNATTDEKLKDEALCDTDNSQENKQSATSLEKKTEKSRNFFIHAEKYYTRHDVTIDNKIKDRLSICEHNVLTDNSQENIDNVMMTTQQLLENSSLIFNTENMNKDHTYAHNEIIALSVSPKLDIDDMHLNKDIEKKSNIYTITEKANMQTILQNQKEVEEMHDVEIIDLTNEDAKTQNDAMSNLELSTTHESISCDMDKKDGCNRSQNTKDGQIVEQSSVIKSESNSPKSRHDTITVNSSTSSNKSNSSDGHSSDSHLEDNDNNSDIEVEIKIKPKWKSRVSRKFSIKAPWSAVNSCIKNLHTLKDNPSFLELFQMNHKTSFERFQQGITNSNSKNSENNTSNLNQDVTAECIESVVPSTKKDICDSNPITKDNYSQEKFQDYAILVKDKNITMDCNQEGNELVQSVKQKSQITVENNLELNKFVCNVPNLRAQLQASTNDKEKINEEQISHDNTLERIESTTKHNQREQNESMTSIEKQKTQLTGNNTGSAKAACDTNTGEQLPSLDVTHNKVRVRSIEELNYQRCTTQTINHDPSITSNIACPKFLRSVFSQLAPSQSVSSQSVPSQSIPLQLVSPLSCQTAPSQSTLPQSALAQSSSQSVSPQSVFKQRPSYNNNVKEGYSSSKTGTETKSSNISNDLINSQITTQIVTENIYNNFLICRNLSRYNLSPTHLQKMNECLKQIRENMERLKVWHQLSFQDVVVFINQTMQLSPPISELEYNTYIRLYTSSMTRNSGQYDATANTLQYSNITEAFYRSPETSVSNVNPHPFSNARMSNNSNFAQSLTTPCLTPTIPNINQQQFLNNSANSSQVPYLRQTAPNIRQQYMRYAPTVQYSSMPKINQQPPFRNANHLIQGQRMSSANMSNVSNQQIFENMNNVSSTSNINMRSYGLISQGNINTSPHMKQLCVASKSIINNTTTISATNVQQQRQVYSQTSQNSGTVIYPPSMTNQNVPLRMQQSVHNNVISESFITNSNTSKTDVAMGNVRPGNITRQSNCNLQVSQVFSKEMQSLSQYNQNPNNIYVTSSQPACSNTQTNPVRNILTNPNARQKMQQNQRVNQSKDLSINNTSTNAQQNVPKKRRKSKSQNKTQSINSQDVSQNASGIILKTSIPQGSDIPHKSTIEYAMLKTLQKDKTISISPNTLALSKIDKTAYNFNLAILTDIQKIVLRDQIKLYFLISSKLQHLFTRQEFDGAYQEKSISMLLHLYHHLDNYINEIRSQITRRDTENWQNSQNISMLQNVRTEMSSDKLTKSQSDKNNSECDRNSEKQSSEENNNSSISTNSVTVVKNNVSTEIQNAKSAFTALKSTITKESLPTSAKLQEQNSDILKEKLNKPSLLDAKRKERHKNLETLLLRRSKTPEDNSVTEMSHMNSETEMQSNIKINEIFSMSLTKSSYGRQISESRSPSTQDSSNLLRGTLTNKIVSQVEIAKSNIKEGSNNTREESIREIPSIMTSNNGRENDTISQSCNKEDQNRKVNYANNEISRKNSQDVISDDIMENTEILNSTVSDPSNVSNNLIRSSLNVCLISPVKRCKSVETLHMRAVREEHAETSDFSLNTQQKDLANEQSNTSSVETSDSFGELYIDESADALRQERHDQVAAEEDKLNMSQDSAHSFDAIKLESTEATSLSFLLRNIAEKDLVDIRQDFVTEEVEKFNVKSPLETQEVQLPKISKKLETSEGTWIEGIPLTDIVEKQIEDKNERRCSLKIEEMQFQEIPLKFEVPSKSEDASSIEDSDTIQWIDLKLSEDEEEEEEVDTHTHSGIKIINEQLKQVSEPRYYEKSQTFALKDNPIDVNEREVSTENDILNVDYNAECISEERDDSEMRIANILNVGSISPSLFERMNNDTVVEKDLEAFADENGEKSLYINDHLESTDEVDERPCLRCKRKSTVYCQACLEAHYCSKRCSSLHWKAEHYKQCKGRNDSVICIDV